MCLLVESIPLPSAGPKPSLGELGVGACPSGGYLSTVCGTETCHFLGVLFSSRYGIMGIIFTNF